MKIAKYYLKEYILKIENKTPMDGHIKKHTVILEMDFIQKYIQKETKLFW